MRRCCRRSVFLVGALCGGLCSGLCSGSFGGFGCQFLVACAYCWQPSRWPLRFGLAPLLWLPYNAVGIAVGFETLVLLVALHLHVKSNHEWYVRQATLVKLDPLTEFSAPLYFPDIPAQLWSQACHMRQDIAVAYICADTDVEGSEATSPGGFGLDVQYGRFGSADRALSYCGDNLRQFFRHVNTT